MIETPTVKLPALQVLRAVAAITIVLHHVLRAYTVHATGPAAASLPALLRASWLREGLAVGVDIFFVISGFMMVYIAKPYVDGRKRRRDFLWQRFTRIYPAYWIATLLLLAGPLLKGNTAGLTFDRVTRSFLLVPGFNREGLIQPLLGVGWTLSYELYFYLMFFAALALVRTQYRVALVTMIAGTWAAATWMGDGSAIGRFLADPIVFEFLLGCLLGWFVSRYGRRRMPVILPLVAVLAIFCAASLQEAGAVAPVWRCLYWGIPAMAIVAYAVSLDLVPTTMIRRVAVLLGDASFSIYLTHVPVIYGMKAAALAAPAADGQIAAAILASMIVAIAIGLVFYFLIERPINRWRHRCSEAPKPTWAMPSVRAPAM